MFLPKVGSDACLILTYHWNDDSKMVIDQKFTETDLIEAMKTRDVSIVETSAGYLNKLLVVTVAENEIDALSFSGTVEFAKDENGVWIGDYSESDG